MKVWDWDCKSVRNHDYSADHYDFANQAENSLDFYYAKLSTLI